jgi:hypothetical protein
MDNPWLSMGDPPPFIAECDRAILDEQHIASYQLRCDVLPHAWIGNPRSASALLLQLNPGFAESDVAEEADICAYRPTVRRSLELAGETTFWALDDELRETGAARWWRARLRRLLDTVGDETVHQRLAVVEYFPYHSVGYAWPPRLPSQDFGFALVRGAVCRGATIVVMRQWESWRAAVPELIGYKGTFINQHPRQASVSAANLGDESWDALVGALSIRPSRDVGEFVRPS